MQLQQDGQYRPPLVEDPDIVVPEGYTLVWNDEFNKGTTLNSADWTHEVQPAGWVNHELQTYVNGSADGKRVTEIKDGFLHINCFKGSDGKVYSGRVYAHVGSGWTYGYFEARICLPSGKGTWPAFWMMPVGNDRTTNPWPTCGEIDIMEEVGATPNEVSSSLHTEKYNHTKNTQKTHAMNCPGAEGEFHVYALEWTEDAITTYVDGKVQLRATRTSMGTDHASWPFHYAFYPILNLAWGVVLVTTKKGTDGRATVTYNFSYGWQSVGKKVKVLDASQYMMMKQEGYLNAGQSVPSQYQGDAWPMAKAMTGRKPSSTTTLR